jgi:hypothetical protein
MWIISGGSLSPLLLGINCSPSAKPSSYAGHHLAFYTVVELNVTDTEQSNAARSGKSAYLSKTGSSLLKKGGVEGEIHQAAKTNAALWPLQRILDSLVVQWMSHALSFPDCGHVTMLYWAPPALCSDSKRQKFGLQWRCSPSPHLTTHSFINSWLARSVTTVISLQAGRPGFGFRRGRTFLFATTSRPAVGPTQTYLYRMVAYRSFPGVKTAGVWS